MKREADHSHPVPGLRNHAAILAFPHTSSRRGAYINIRTISSLTNSNRFSTTTDQDLDILTWKLTDRHKHVLLYS